MSQGLDMWSVALLVSVCDLVHGLSRIDPLVSTNGGLIRGLRSDHGYAKFLGVPYAVVDKNNPFGPSIPHPGFDDIFEAYESNVCPQVYNDVPMGSIDCLTMDIYVPDIANSRNQLPVMVWIHGGGFLRGSAGKEGSDPISLLRNDVIVVAINYRLGVYGFMCLDLPEVSGNQGLKDQVLALRWIKENIEDFGGDSRQVTVFGESAGGMSANLHLFSSYEKLFQRVIIQSGPAQTPWLSMESDNTIPLILAKGLNFDTTDVSEALEYLWSIDAHTLVKAVHDWNPFIFGDTIPLFGPCIEKEFEDVENFITDHPRNIISSKASTTPVIIGYNDNELSVRYENINAEDLDNFNFGNELSLAFDLGIDLDDAKDAVRHFYIGDEKTDENVRWNLADFVTDFIFGHPTQRAAEQLLNNGANTVYRYVFSYKGGRNMLQVAMNLNLTGATHADELGYLFDLEIFSEETTPEDQLVVDRMTTLWTNFAKHGNPTPETSKLLPVIWEPITTTTQPYLEINSDLSLQSRPFHERMAFWDVFYKLYEKYQKWSEGSSK